MSDESTSAPQPAAVTAPGNAAGVKHKGADKTSRLFANPRSRSSPRSG